MKLKGTMVLELTDGATGEVETVTEENMVTEAVNDILGMNPMGVFYSEERLADVLSWNDVLLPVCPNMVGGILLFSKALEEDAGHIYELSDNLPVAYASNNVNTTANAARGSLNQTESKVLEDGYKFVWEFTPSQGNGGGADQRPGRAERVREPGGGWQRISADQEAGYRGSGEGEAGCVV